MDACPTPPPRPLSGTLDLGGVIRERPEDFLVEEIPLYEPEGAGEHLMLFVEKRLLTTEEAASRLARALDVPEREVGFGGLKDRRAVTRQWFSVEGVPPERARGLVLDGLRVLAAERHGNKLKRGHLAANRFRIRIRRCRPDRIESAPDLLQRLAAEGLPNGFGPQRFGTRRDNHLLGAALVRDDPQAFLEILCTPRPEVEQERIMQGREALGAGDFKAALRLFPRRMALEWHLARALMARPEDLHHAVRTIPSRVRSLLVSAWQSEIFNRVLQARLGTLTTLLPGDVAVKLSNGACFLVEDPAAEAERVERREILPTGPLPGEKMLRAAGEAAALEDPVLLAAGHEPGWVSSLLPRKAFRGARRPLAIHVSSPRAEVEDPGTLVLEFTLPRGAFATALLAAFGVLEAPPPGVTGR